LGVQRVQPPGVAPQRPERRDARDQVVAVEDQEVGEDQNVEDDQREEEDLGHLTPPLAAPEGRPRRAPPPACPRDPAASAPAPRAAPPRATGPGAPAPARPGPRPRRSAPAWRSPGP